MHAVGIEQQDRAEHARALCFDDTRKQVECFVKSRAAADELEDLVLTFQQICDFANLNWPHLII
jgi:hypothetical protein